MYKSRGALKSEAKAFLKGSWLKSALVLLIVFAITVALAVVPMVGPIVLILVAPALQVGCCTYFLELCQNGKAKFSRMFKGFELLGKSAWLFILTEFFTFLWSLLFVVPGIVKSYSYSMAPYILAQNPDMTARQALKESIRLTKGHKGRLFVLELSFLGWGILALIPMLPFEMWINQLIAMSSNGLTAALMNMPVYVIAGLAVALVAQTFLSVYIQAVTANQYTDLINGSDQ